MKLAFLSSGSPAAEAARQELRARHQDHDPADADVIVALGGDGFMLEALPRAADLGRPVYGMNRGTVGFLMNSFDPEGLPDRVRAARRQTIHPLCVEARLANGEMRRMHAINEVSVLRQGAQAANLRIAVDGEERLDALAGDGILLATPAGSTAYNYSAFGPILPIGANVLALTPIAAFRPRRWRGAVLPDRVRLRIDNRDPVKRPVLVSADSASVEGAVSVDITLDTTVSHHLLFDPGHGLEERILSEQFT